MKTAIQELEDKLKDNLKWIVMNADYELMDKLFQEGLVKEKEQIKKAHFTGWEDAYEYISDFVDKQPRQAEDYYNQTYTQNK